MPKQLTLKSFIAK